MHVLNRCFSRTLSLGVVLVLLSIQGYCAWGQGLAEDTNLLRQLDAAGTMVIDKEELPGAVVLLSQHDRILFRKAFGFAQLYEFGMKRLSEPEPMTPEHVFDLASMTKVLAATMGMMLLVDRKAVSLEDPVYKYLPEFRGESKDSITVRHLLTHSSGLFQWQPLYLYASNSAETYRRICEMPLQSPVGKQRRYSDLGFMLLGYIIEKVSGQPLDEFLKVNLYRPLGLKSTSYTPLKVGLKTFAATSHGNPYEYKMVADTTFGYRVLGDPDADTFKGWRQYTLKGVTNDGNAFYANNGTAGHAGLFSTVDDIQTLLSVMLHEGEFRGKSIYSKEVVKLFTEKNEFGHGLGWQITRMQDSAGHSMTAIGHGGFTGTFGAFVPEHGIVFVILTNRQNLGPRPNGFYNDIRTLQRGVTQALIGSLSRSQ